MERFDELTPRARARVTGVVYLAYFVLAVVGELFLEQAGLSSISPASSDAGTLASKVLRHQASLQAGVAVSLMSVAAYVAVTVLFYQLFKPVGRTIALSALVFGLVAMAISAVATCFDLAPLAALNGAGGGLTAAQTHGLALVFVKVGNQLGPIGLFFSGLFQILNGYLMFRSGFLPRVFGLLLTVAGVGWLLFLAPIQGDPLATVLDVLGFVAEAALMLWLLIRGIDSGRWITTATAEARAAAG